MAVVGTIGSATTATAASVELVSPGCDASLHERMDWATKVDAQQAETTARVTDTPTEAQLGYYTALRLCDGEVIHESGDALYGPKSSGQAPPSNFQPSGTATSTSKRRHGRSGRTLTCTNTAYDPQFPGDGTVRGGGRSACNMTTSLTASACAGRYFQSTGNTDQQGCNGGTVTAAAITVYSLYISCSTVISYRTNYYGATGNAFTLYFNGASWC